jgi:hypothetical protein
MEGIQMAQMLADLSDINAAEARAAKALVNANKHLTSEPSSPTGIPTIHEMHQVTGATHSDSHLAPPKRPVDMVRSESSDGRTGRNGSPHSYPIFHHRRMLTSPPMSRCASATPSIPGTPRRELEVSLEPVGVFFPPRSRLELWLTGARPWQDDDADKAATIMRLYEIRAKLRQHHDNDALSRAREKIAALAEKQRLHQQQQGATSPGLDEDKHSPHD